MSDRYTGYQEHIALLESFLGVIVTLQHTGGCMFLLAEEEQTKPELILVRV
jgi:hypothetical protein